jgi:hypothetical protein
MAQRPFREKHTGASPAEDNGNGDGNGDKDEFEDKVHQEFGQFKVIVDQLKQKSESGKVEKDEGADKYASDKYNKDHKEQKHEKLEKEHKDIAKEHIKDTDIKPTAWAGSPFVPAQTDPQLLARIAALEEAVGKLLHFIPAESRPDLSRGALKDEPDAPTDGAPPTRRRRR